MTTLVNQVCSFSQGAGVLWRFEIARRLLLGLLRLGLLVSNGFVTRNGACTKHPQSIAEATGSSRKEAVGASPTTARRSWARVCQTGNVDTELPLQSAVGVWRSYGWILAAPGRSMLKGGVCLKLVLRVATDSNFLGACRVTPH